MGNPRLVDMTGQVFDRWSVVEKAGNLKGGAALWRCRCTCGNEGVVMGWKLRSGWSRSCGCLKNETSGARLATHRLSGTRLHKTWKNMRTRCGNPKSVGWKDYGGRGITVDPAWHNFATFHAWAMASGYADNLTLERVDVNGGYTPANCTWVPRADQAWNRQATEKDPDGTPWSLVAERNGISRAAYRTRRHYGWPPEVAATKTDRKWRPKADRMS